MRIHPQGTWPHRAKQSLNSSPKQRVYSRATRNLEPELIVTYVYHNSSIRLGAYTRGRPSLSPKSHCKPAGGLSERGPALSFHGILHGRSTMINVASLRYVLLVLRRKFVRIPKGRVATSADLDSDGGRELHRASETSTEG